MCKEKSAFFAISVLSTATVTRRNVVCRHFMMEKEVANCSCIAMKERLRQDLVINFTT